LFLLVISELYRFVIWTISLRPQPSFAGAYHWWRDGNVKRLSNLDGGSYLLYLASCFMYRAPNNFGFRFSFSVLCNPMWNKSCVRKLRSVLCLQWFFLNCVPFPSILFQFT
jgi:hypothetical protein